MTPLFDNNLCQIASFLSPGEARISSQVCQRFYQLNREQGINAYQPLDHLVSRTSLVNGLQTHFRAPAYRRLLAKQSFREGQAIGNRYFSTIRREWPTRIAYAMLICDITLSPNPLVRAGAVTITLFVTNRFLFYVFRDDGDLNYMTKAVIVLFHNNTPIRTAVKLAVLLVSRIFAVIQEVNPALLPEVPGDRRIYGVFCGVFTATKAYVMAHPLSHILIRKINYLQRKLGY